MDKKRSENVPVKRRNEKEGVFNFTKEMASALIMAFIAIVYVIQAFKIPTGSMEKSLLIGDFLLGLKFIYGSPALPFSYKKFPGISKPKPGDVVIFEYPGTDNKDYIKRCIAGPGQTIEIRGKKFLLDGKELILPPKGQYVQEGRLFPEITNFTKLRIPQKGDTIRIHGLPVREFLFLRNLIKQEHPRNRLIKFLESNFVTRGFFKSDNINKNILIKLQLYIDGEYSNHVNLKGINVNGRPFSFNLNDPDLNIYINQIDNWITLKGQIMQFEETARQAYPDTVKIEILPSLILKGKRITEYIVQRDNYFMIGDNRDNSMDSRYWGYVNRNFVKAKAFILYFSLDKDIPVLLLPLKIRWNRIGKLIRGWDGLEKD